MTQIGAVYADALYTLAQEENLTAPILEELTTLDSVFRQEPDYIRLLSAPNLSKQERCNLLDESFGGKLQPYVLNFLKILTEKGYMRHFSDCCKAYRNHYNLDNGIVAVTAVTAVPLSDDQFRKLTGKLEHITGKRIELLNRVDPASMGGVRLDFDGKQMDDTVAHRLDDIRKLLQNTVL